MFWKEVSRQGRKVSLDVMMTVFYFVILLTKKFLQCKPKLLMASEKYLCRVLGFFSGLRGQEWGRQEYQTHCPRDSSSTT